MSKAFTRESDDMPEQPVLPRAVSSLPPGVKNYITADGARALREELDRLVQVERPRIAAEPDSKRELLIIDQRIAQVDESLRTAVVVPPPSVPENKVKFGATVTVRDRRGTELNYRLVGIDEVDTDRDWISWRSPLARALMNAEAGHKVRVRLPSGEEELQIISVSYE
jgi:transcription elongation factor GreB